LIKTSILPLGFLVSTPKGYIGDPKDGIGYVDLSGFANDAGREVRYAIRVLQHGSEMLARSVEGAPVDDGGKVNVDDIDTTKLKVRGSRMT
jgi:hypothetical protein